MLMKLVKHRKEQPGPLAPVSRAWSPFWTLPWLEENIDRLFNEPFAGWFPPMRTFEWAPAADVYEDKNNLFVKVELPGMKKEDIKVSVTGDTLNITGLRKEEAEYKEAETYCTERYFGHFQRAIALPTSVVGGKIQAHYKDGILTVTCPKTEEAKRHETEIKVS